jgi:Family of unknown function (DUF6314)
VTSCPVVDLRAFLLGTWRISRRIRDFRLGISGRLVGCASFTPAPGGLSYEEVGLLQFGAYEGEATQRYSVAIDRPTSAELRFADGRPFHRLELASGAADVVHRCAADRYRGRYRVSGADRLTVLWRVTGPRKRYTLATLHARIAATDRNSWRRFPSPTG